MGSVFSVSKLVRSRSGTWKSRKAIPPDVRAEYAAIYGQRWEVIFSRPAGTPMQQAKADHAKWLAEVEQRIAALRAAKGGGSRDLTQREADALAGEWYRAFVARHTDNAGSAAHWHGLAEILRELLELDPDDAYHRLDYEAHTTAFLTDRGITLSPSAWTLFHIAVAREFLVAAETLQCRARGDWSPDRHEVELAPLGTLGTFTTPKVGNGGSTGAFTAVQLFEAYCLDKKPKPSTIARWRHVFPALDAAGWQRLDWDAQRWADDLVRPGNSARSVRDTWIAAPRAVWKWAQRKRLVSSNPFVGVTVEVPRRVETRETGRAFTENEAVIILRAALRLPAVPRIKAGSRIIFAEAAWRWVPWLCAYTGARVGEITQLRVCDIEQRPCGHVLRITPEAGPVKTDKVRLVPIHDHLVTMDLLAYVEAVKAQMGSQGVLFSTGKMAKGRGPSTRTREKLAKWVRSIGVTDRAVQPNHGWRHTFKQRARRAGIEPGIRDAMCGHAPRSTAEKYEHVPVEDMAVALKRFPRYEVE